MLMLTIQFINTYHSPNDISQNCCLKMSEKALYLAVYKTCIYNGMTIYRVLKCGLGNYHSKLELLFES